MGEAVGDQGFDAFGRVARQGIAHLDGRRQFPCAPVKRESPLCPAPRSGLELTPPLVNSGSCGILGVFSEVRANKEFLGLGWRLDLGVNRDTLSQGSAPGTKSDCG